ncbi:hypothetical protein XM25_07995 [Devosia sp. H5989]|nr:hypothetical protein XM25_07995 [Devosia sp. H5989]
MAYIIIEDDQVLDGEIIRSEADLFNKLPGSDFDAQVIEFDVGELRRDKSAPMRDVSEDVVRAADAAGAFTDPENDRQCIAGRFLDFPLTRDEIDEDRAERRFEEDRYERMMGA